MNKVILSGELTQDPVLNITPKGTPVGSAVLKTTEIWQDDLEQNHESVQFHLLVIWGHAAKKLTNFFKKGDKLYVEGKLQTTSWSHQGIRRTKTEIIIKEFRTTDGDSDELTYEQIKS